MPNKNVFFNNNILDVFLFVTAVISILATTVAMNTLCNHKICRTLVASLALQQIKELDAVATQEQLQYIECTCIVQWCTILMLNIVLALKLFVIIKMKKLKLFRGYLFLKTVKIMLFI